MHVIHTIDITDKTFMVTKEAWPKVDNVGVQRAEKTTGLPMWATEMVCTDADGGTIITVTTAGKQPDLDVGEHITPIALVAHFWTTNGRSGVSYRADRIEIDEE